MWFGFSASNGDSWCMYYILNWTFTSYGVLPMPPNGPKHTPNFVLIIGIPVGILVAALCITIVFCKTFKARTGEMHGNIELVGLDGLPEYIRYKQLRIATKQFSAQSKLGEGGFGSVYRGILPRTCMPVAVKRISNNSRQGKKEFLAEVSIISQLRHRNVVQLMGYCSDRDKFLLVYELLPKGSLDKALFNPKGQGYVLSWNTRWKIAFGIAAALQYLHEGWRRQVIHRDVKASNIMLDDEYNAKLGDFGLARLVDHQKNAATTMVAGTYGYLAPEATRGKFTDKTDVYAFGAVALEIACGRKSFAGSAEEDDMVLADVVWRRLGEGNLLAVVDPRLQGDFDERQMELLLLLGLLCSHPSPAARPSMRQVIQVLSGDAPLPPVPTSKPEPVFAADETSVYVHGFSTHAGRVGAISKSSNRQLDILSSSGKAPTSELPLNLSTGDDLDTKLVACFHCFHGLHFDFRRSSSI